jgi:tetratricopeptide (TPR) repeat protein
MDTMGRAYRSLGLYTPAKDLLGRALALRRASLGRDDPRTAESLHALALLLHQTGDDAAAEPLVREAVDIQLRVYGEEHEETLKGLNNLASLLGERGEWGPAEALYRRVLRLKREALAIFQESQPPSTVHIADAKSVLGGCLAAQGRTAEAEALLRAGWEGLKDARGEDARYREQARRRLAAVLAL